MNLSEIAPNIIPQAGKPEARVLPETPDKNIANLKILDTSDNSLHRKSIYTDHKGVLISQTTDSSGDVVAIYPSKEVIRRYHSIIEQTG
jgi:hypothetical protein